MINEAKNSTDAEFRKDAVDFAKRLRRFLEDEAMYLDQEFTTAKIEGKTSYLIPAKRIHPRYKNLIILFREAGGKYHSPAFGQASGRPLIFLPIIDPRADNLEKLYMRFTSKIQGIFVHEFIHFLDHLRFKGKGRDTRSGDSYRRGDVKGYFNTPAELNAYTQEGIYGIEDTIENTKSLFKSQPEKVKSVLQNLVPKDFRKFATDKHLGVWFDKDFLKNLTAKNKQRVLKRLYQWHKDMVSELY